MLRFSSELVFDPGRADISKNDIDRFKFLDAVGDLLKEGYHHKKLFQRLYIEGHTDTNPIRNRHYKSNWELSTARALYIANHFIRTDKIRPEYSDERLFGISGYGEYNFVESVNDLDSNRRIEILLVYSEKR
nr:OmpA family protein [Desulfobacter latus]